MLTQCSFHMFEVIQKDKSIQRWKRLEERRLLHIMPRRASEATLSRDCSQLLTASWDRSAKLWPLQTFRKTRTAPKKKEHPKQKKHEQHIKIKINFKLILIEN